jgi:hypothetical protein
MAKTARQFVFDGMELVTPALAPFVEARLSSSITGHWQVTVRNKCQLGPAITASGNEYLLDGCVQECPWSVRTCLGE